MPKKNVQKVHINITIDEDLNEWVEKTAVELRLNKSQLINNLISIGKDDIKVLKAMGLFGLRNWVRKVREGGLVQGEGVSVKAAK
ncbi:MAG: hypothetical protein ABSH06_04440 [Thermodesulfobacteriota bacterium]